jgi:hypothetical protein
MPKTPIAELKKMEGAVRKEFGDVRPTKAQVIAYLRTQYFPKMDAGLREFIEQVIHYAPLASLVLASWGLFGRGKKPPKCPFCPLRQVTVDQKGRSVCPNGHKWRPGQSKA